MVLQRDHDPGLLDRQQRHLSPCLRNLDAVPGRCLRADAEILREFELAWCGIAGTSVRVALPEWRSRDFERIQRASQPTTSADPAIAILCLTHGVCCWRASEPVSHAVERQVRSQALSAEVE